MPLQDSHLYNQCEYTLSQASQSKKHLQQEYLQEELLRNTHRVYAQCAKQDSHLKEPTWFAEQSVIKPPLKQVN